MPGRDLCENVRPPRSAGCDDFVPGCPWPISPRPGRCMRGPSSWLGCESHDRIGIDLGARRHELIDLGGGSTEQPFRVGSAAEPQRTLESFDEKLNTPRLPIGSASGGRIVVSLLRSSAARTGHHLARIGRPACDTKPELSRGSCEALRDVFRAGEHQNLGSRCVRGRHCAAQSGREMGTPLRRTPLRLPISSICAPSSLTVMRAWRRRDQRVVDS